MPGVSGLPHSLSPLRCYQLHPYHSPAQSDMLLAQVIAPPPSFRCPLPPPRVPLHLEGDSHTRISAPVVCCGACFVHSSQSMNPIKVFGIRNINSPIFGYLERWYIKTEIGRCGNAKQKMVPCYGQHRAPQSGMWQEKQPTRLPRSASEPLLQWRIVVLSYTMLGLGLAQILRPIITIELCM